MAQTNVLLLIRIAGYAIGVIVSLCIVVPMSLHHSNFDGHCLLFSQGWWSDKGKKMIVTWASPLYCQYVLFVGIIVMVVCFIQIYRLLMLWVEGRDSSFLSTFLEAAGCLVLCGLVVSVAIMVTLGFVRWCQSVSQWFPSCEDVAGQQIGKIDNWTENFYVEMEVTQVGTWAAFTTLVGIVVASTLKFLRYHQIQNNHAVMYSERNGERQPLLNSGFVENGLRAEPA